MKPIEETHPSFYKHIFRNSLVKLKDVLTKGMCLAIQENTIDKAVLLEILNNWNCHNEEIKKTINTLKFKLELEE